MQPSGCLVHVHGATGSYWKNLLITLIDSQKKLLGDKSLKMRRIPASSKGSKWRAAQWGAAGGLQPHGASLRGLCGAQPKPGPLQSHSSPTGISERILWEFPALVHQRQADQRNSKPCELLLNHTSQVLLLTALCSFIPQGLWLVPSSPNSQDALYGLITHPSLTNVSAAQPVRPH